MNSCRTFSNGSTMSRDDLGAWADYALGELGIEGWRPYQRDIITDTLCGNSVIATIPTGGGKSLTYQLAAKLADLTRESCRFFCPSIVVVSPLLGLMRNQIDEAERLGIPAIAINSDQTKSERRVALNQIQNYRLIYCAPEMLRDEEMRALIAARASMLVIDEAHCISSWGHDFRPAYARFGQWFRRVAPSIPVLALTATATEATIADMARCLGLSDAALYLTMPYRQNLSYNCQAIPVWKKEALEAEWVKRIVTEARRREQVMVYSQTQAIVDKLSGDTSPLFDYFDRHQVVGYHGDTSPDRRNAASQAMQDGTAKVGIFSPAAGMGINWSRVDCVMHLRPPGRLEALAQEAGRAGRAGQPATHICLYDPSWDRVPTMFLEAGNPPLEVYRKVWGWLRPQNTANILKGQAEMAREAGVDEIYASTVFAQLREWGWISMRSQNPDERQFDAFTGKKIHHAIKITTVQGDFEPDQIPLDPDMIKMKKDRDSRGLEAVRAYLTNRKGLCRQSMIGLYFNKKADPGYRCGSCDVCNVPF